MLVKDAEGHQALQEAFYGLLSRLVTLEGEIGDALAVKWGCDNVWMLKAL